MWHCVDDVAGVEGAKSAPSSFEGFKALSELHGLKTKTKKEQPPADCHRIQGIGLRMGDEEVVVEPLKARREKIVAELTNILRTEWCPPQGWETGREDHVLDALSHGKSG